MNSLMNSMRWTRLIEQLMVLDCAGNPRHTSPVTTSEGVESFVFSNKLRNLDERKVFIESVSENGSRGGDLCVG